MNYPTLSLSQKLLFPLLLAAVLLTASCLGRVGPRGGSGVAEGEGVIYIASNQGRSFALSPESRSRGLPFPAEGEWVSPESKGRIIYATPVLGGDTLYLATFKGEVFAFNLASGTPRGEDPLFQGKPIIATPLLTPEALIIPSGNALYAVDPNSGTELWAQPFQAGKPLWSSPALLEDKVIVGSLDGKLYAVDLRRGTEVWSKQTKGGIASPPLVADGIIYVGSFDGNLYAWNGRGRPHWKSPFPAGNWLWSRPLYYEGRVYFGDFGGNFYAVTAATGKKVWSYSASGEIRSSPVVAGDTIVFATTQGVVYALNAANGTLEWQHALEEATPVTADLLASQGTVYIPYQSGNLYAVEAETGKTIWSFSLKR